MQHMEINKLMGYLIVVYIANISLVDIKWALRKMFFIYENTSLSEN